MTYGKVDVTHEPYDGWSAAQRHARDSFSDMLVDVPRGTTHIGFSNRTRCELTGRLNGSKYYGLRFYKKRTEWYVREMGQGWSRIKYDSELPESRGCVLSIDAIALLAKHFG